MANLLGHIDPKTGDIKEYLTGKPMSGPHGLVMDKQGNIWFTANFKAYIGELFRNAASDSSLRATRAADIAQAPDRRAACSLLATKPKGCVRARSSRRVSDVPSVWWA